MENPVSPANNVADLAFARYDRLVKPLLGAVFRSGYTVTCGRKCSACCSEPAVCSKQEAEVMADAYRSLPEEDQARVRDELRSWLERFEQAGFLGKEHVQLYEYRKAKLPCPFLKDQECSIYASRPLCCRGHMALGPREKCEKDDLRPDQLYVMVDGVMHECYAAMLEHEDLVLDYIGIWLAELILGVVKPSRLRNGLKVTNRPV